MKFIGRILARRVQGHNLSFIDVQQEERTIQIVLDSKILKCHTPVSRSDIVEVDCVTSPKGQYCATTLKLLTRSATTSSLLPSAKTGILAEVKYRKRYLDLIINSTTTIKRFKNRSAIIRGIRTFLERRNFIEVETPIIQSKPNGATARPFKIMPTTTTATSTTPLSLRISPELPLKTLLVGGLERVFEIGKVFRNESADPTHNPEFTSLELYQSFSGLSEMRALLEDLLCSIGSFSVNADFNNNDNGCDIGNDIGYGDSNNSNNNENCINVNINNSGVSINKNGQNQKQEIPQYNVMDVLYKEFPSLKESWNVKDLQVLLKDEAVDALRAEDPCYLWDRLISTKVEGPLCKMHKMFFLYNHPLILSPLAKGFALENKFEVGERFEFFIAGMEIANAYEELTDPVEQRKRFQGQGVCDEEYIDALKIGLPPCSGMGIGIDRLVMSLLGLSSIKDCILYPFLKNKS